MTSSFKFFGKRPQNIGPQTPVPDILQPKHHVKSNSMEFIFNVVHHLGAHDQVAVSVWYGDSGDIKERVNACEEGREIGMSVSCMPDVLY